MATGLLIDTVEEAPFHAGSSVDLDDVTTGAVMAVVDPGDQLGGTVVSGVPSVLAQNVVGHVLRLWDFTFHGVIHVIPRTKTLGAIVSDVLFQIEVWNADDTPHQLTGITQEGSDGVSYANGAPVPSYFAPFTSAFYDITVDKDGDPLVDHLLTWIFPGFTGTDSRLTGFRISIFPVAPQWDQEYLERYGYQTDVQTKRLGHEQRRLLRALPTRELVYSGFAPDVATAGDLSNKLYAGGQFLFAVPYWPDKSPLTAAASMGNTTIQVDTTTRTFTAGDLVLLWRDERTWEAATIVTVNPTNLVLASGIVRTAGWPAASTLVIPLLTAFPDGMTRESLPAPGVGDFPCSFVSEPTT